eukprot:4871012-Pyramimonas_sp.AAC.1
MIRWANQRCEVGYMMCEAVLGLCYCTYLGNYCLRKATLEVSQVYVLLNCSTRNEMWQSLSVTDIASKCGHPSLWLVSKQTVAINLWNRML